MRFVILHHIGIDEPHYDLLFETSPGSQLSAFRSPAWPVLAPTPLTQLRDHRRIYLQYQGPVSNDRGNVLRVADGSCEVQASSGQFTLTLDGKVILQLRQIAGQDWLAEPVQSSTATS